MPDNQYATYIRKSTDKQSDQHQRADIRDWLDENGIEISEVDFYAETGSGASSTRDEFTALLESIEDDEYTDIVVWEVSRIARKGFLAQRFFDACEEHGVTIHITNGSVRRIEPDGTGRLIGDMISSVAAEKRRSLIRRTRSGQKQARKAGKWVGNPPVGFTVVDGFLKPNLDPDYEEGETGFFDVVEAMECVEAGQSYNKTAKQTPNVTRQTLSKIHQDEQRQAWYLSGDADDDRVQDALGTVAKTDTGFQFYE
jgi:DNA invertase Pin-like site-specific DNA recombinase